MSAHADFQHRIATHADIPALRAMVERAIDDLQQDFLTPEQIQASHQIMGIDSTLIDDGTYFVVERDGQIAGCGGWSRRATLFGGDHTVGRDVSFVDPAIQPAKVRAMYTNPAFARQGVGRMILALCESAAASHGFRTLELMATMAGQPLYTAYGFVPVEPINEMSTGVPIPLMRMTKAISGESLAVAS